MAQTRSDNNKTNEEIYQQKASSAFIYSSAFGCLTVVALILYAIDDSKAGRFWSLLGILIVIAFASIAAGAIIGFLFGIPHSSSDDNKNSKNNSATQTNTSSGNDTNTSSNNLRPSTNLEQISDWLTKIIIGVSLVEAKKIITGFGTLCDTLGAAIKNYSDTSDNSSVIAGAIIIIFVIIGFLIVYLWTYLYLILIRFFLGIDQLISKKISDNDENNRIANDLAIKQLTCGYSTTIPFTDLAEAFRAATMNTLSNIYYKAVDIWENCWRDDFQRYKIALTVPIFEALAALDNNKDFPENYLQLGYSLKDQINPQYQRALENIKKGLSNIGLNSSQINTSLAHYNLAYCLIALDKNFNTVLDEHDNRTESSEDVKNEIKAYLDDAKKDAAVKTLILHTSDKKCKEDPLKIVKKWLDTNHLSLD